MYELGKLYLKQKCGEDRERAFQWLTIGGRFGSSESKIEAEKLASRLSQTQRKRVTGQAERWIAEHSGAQEEEEEKEREEQ
jgi:hypothetical protein